MQCARVRNRFPRLSFAAHRRVKLQGEVVDGRWIEWGSEEAGEKGSVARRQRRFAAQCQSEVLAGAGGDGAVAREGGRSVRLCAGARASVQERSAAWLRRFAARGDGGVCGDSSGCEIVRGRGGLAIFASFVAGIDDASGAAVYG